MIGKDILFQLSVRSVRLHFLRSVLAALGIVIGVVAIAAMGMMGANMTLSVTGELSQMANVLVVTAYTGGGGFMGFGGGGGPPGGGSTQSREEQMITQDQFRDIRDIAGSYGTVYYVYSQSDSIETSDQWGRATIYGLDPDVIKEILEVEEGDYPKSTTSVVVGPRIAERFGLELGSKLEIGDSDEGSTTTVRVVGILKEKGMSLDLSTDSAIVGSEKLYTGIYGDEGEYRQVNIVVDDMDDVDAVKEEILAEMNEKEDEVTVQDSSSMLESITSVLGTITTFVMGIAGVSLVVAAVSIFNVMMMSVTERVREIGILRSIGTQRNDVRRMFLYEAGILGIVGGAIGAVASLVIGYVVVLGMVGTTEFFFSWESLWYIPFAMAIGVSICIISGVYPAWQASNLDPIEALRAE
ncbi:MAG: ABC transporter permease [Methanomicrobiales archaeon]|nr:ABC transporter permease [Methanomicrobiales archaeon]